MKKYLLLLVPFLLFGPLTYAAEQKAAKPKKIILSLDDCLKMALKSNRKILGKAEAIKAARWQKNQASLRFWPQIEYEYSTGPVPKNLDNAIDDYFSANWSLLSHIKTTVALPLYAFGQMSLAKKLANQGVKESIQRKYQEEAKLILDVKKIYHAILLANELKRIGDTAHGQLKSRIKKEEANPNHSPIDLMKLKIFLLEIEKRLSQVYDERKIAMRALKLLIALDHSNFKLKDRHLKPVQAELAPLKDYQMVASQYRPESKLLEVGLDAKQLQLKLEKRLLAPGIGFGGFVEYSQTGSTVTGFTNGDPFNFKRAGLGLQLRGKLDFHSSRAKIKKLEREYHKALLESSMAKEGISLDIEKAYVKAKRARKNVNRADESQTLARRLMFLTKSNYEIGVGSGKEYVDALKSLVETRVAYFKTVFDYNAALAELDEKIGQNLERESPTKIQIVTIKNGGGSREKDAGKELARKTPTKEIKDLDKKLDQYRVGKNLTPSDRRHNEKLKKEILDGTFDVRELSKLALGRHWPSKSPEEKNEFVNLLKGLLEERSLFARERSNGKPYKIKYLGDQYLDKRKKRALTKTSIYVPKEDLNLRLDYKLKRISREWKIFDVIVDNASLVDNYRYSFDQIIKKEGYSELVRRMRKKLSDIKRKRAQS